MDIYRFINSNAIREHLKKLDYPFNALEAAWLVWQCKDATIKEKHAAWSEIIDTMPDVIIEQEAWLAPQNSTHAFLRAYMALQLCWIEEVVNPARPVRYQGDYGGYLELEEFLKREDDRHYVDYYMVYLDQDRVMSFRYDHEAITEAAPVSPSEDEYLLAEAFGSLYLDFPTPFRAGDIIYDTRRFKVQNEEFVLSERIKSDQGYDGSDMVARGWFRDFYGLHYDCLSNYMDFDYADEEKLTGTKRVLKALSNHLHGEIDAVLFARAYHQILTEEHAKELIPNDITKEGLMLAGIQTASSDDDDEREEG